MICAINFNYSLIVRFGLFLLFSLFKIYKLQILEIMTGRIRKIRILNSNLIFLLILYHIKSILFINFVISFSNVLLEYYLQLSYSDFSLRINSNRTRYIH